MSDNSLFDRDMGHVMDNAETPGQSGYTIVPNNYSLQEDHDEYRRHGFKIGDTGILVPADMICEISSDLSLSRMPNAPGWLVGLVNLRGNIVPVLDLTVLLNIFKTDRTDFKQLFFKVDNDWVGILANGLPKPLSLPPEFKMEKLPAMPWELRPYVNSCYKKEGTWFDCDLRAIFAWVEKYMQS